MIHRLPLFILLFLLAIPAGAFAWPAAGAWIPIYAPSGFVQDPGGSLDTTGNGTNHTDIVGDTTNAAAFIYNDGIDIYFRMRIDADPLQGGALKPFGWGVLIDTDLDAHDYEYMLMLDGIANPDEIYLAKNTVQQNIDDPSDKPEQIEWIKLAVNNTDYIASLAETNFTGDPDYFLDFKVPFDIFLLSLGITESSLIRYFYGTSQSAQQLSADLIGSTIYSGVSDFTFPTGKRPTTGSVQFVAALDGSGDLQEFYPSTTLFLKVVDDDQNTLLGTAETVTVSLTAPSGDIETVVLTETGLDTGTFTGSIITAQSAPVANSGILQTLPIEFITATYRDAADALYNLNQNRTDTIKSKPTADLKIVKTASAMTPNTGDTVTFTLTLTNHGPSGGSGIQVRDLLAAGLVYAGDNGSGAYNPSTGIWTVSSLANGGSTALQIQAIMNAPALSTIDNTAVIQAAAQPDFDLSNNSDTLTLAVTGADLQLTKTVAVTTPAIGGDTPQPGDQVTYIVTVTNLGNYNATGVIIRDLLPAGQLTWISHATSGTTFYDPGTGDWLIGALPNGTTETLQIVAQVTAPGGITVTTTASVLAVTESDPVTSNNSVSVSIYVDAADLKIGKTVSDATPDEGDTITFIVRVDNLRGATAGGIQIRDLLPASLQFVSALPPAGTTYDSLSGIWDLGAVTLAAGGFQTLTLNAEVRAGTASQTIINTATIVASNKSDPVAGNNSANVSLAVRYLDLAVDKQTSTFSPNNNSPITFTITITNNGPIDATGVQVYDKLPAQVYNDGSGADRNVAVTASFSDPTDTYSPATRIWNIGTLASGASATLIINATVKIPNGGSATFFNLARIEACDQADPFSGNDAASVLMGVQGTDIAIIKSVDKLAPAPPSGGVFDIVTYTVTVTNNGPNAATNLTISEVLPAGLSYLAGSAAENYTPPAGKTEQTVYTANTGLWTIGYKDGGNTLFPAGTTVTLTLQAEVTAASGTIVTNTALVNSLNEAETNPLNNSASATITVGGTDLQITKTVDTATPTVGDTVIFTLIVNNLGPNVATSVQVRDLLPMGLSYLSHTAGQSYDPATGLWDLGAASIPFGGSAILTITATVDAAASGQTVTNTTTILAAGTPDPIPGNNSDSVDVVVQESDLFLIKTVDNATPDETTNVTFTLTLGNDGPHSAPAIQVLDVLPDGLQYISAIASTGSVTTTVDPGTGTTDVLWDLGAFVLPKNGTATLTITSQTLSGTGASTLTNTAQITGTGNYDPNMANNTSSIAITPNKLYIDLAVTKGVDNATPDEGASFAYTVAVANNNATYAATGVQVLDLLPAGIIIASSAPEAGTSYDLTTGIWDVGTVGPTEIKTLTITARPAAGTGGNGPFTNTATITASNYDDPVAGNNSAAVDVNPVHVPMPSLTVVKSVFAESDPVNGSANPFSIPGARMRYEIQVLNFGDGSPDATSLILADAIPAETSLVVSGTPVAFVDGTPASGISINYAGLNDLTDGVHFCAGADCDYVPVAGPDSTDPAVTQIKVIPTGAMAADTGGGAPNFKINFRVLIK